MFVSQKVGLRATGHDQRKTVGALSCDAIDLGTLFCKFQTSSGRAEIIIYASNDTSVRDLDTISLCVLYFPFSN